ncbi:zinc finger protein 84-like [Venturia canescens]|uniref:zinc finger protein 84-like n=1 Tax=Venturia canescens TaxID=32260 RepID=UPI001C9C338A|nr:zinc finger protein 84-like [Venturia canescens]
MAVSEWDNSCRLCAEEQNEMFSIFGEEGLRRKVAHKLRVCLPVMVYKTDPLPKKICQFCAARLDDVYEFREYCLNVYKSMHRKLSGLKHLKSVQIYMDALNNSPDPCQAQLCKENARAPPPLVPLPVSLPIVKRVTNDSQLALNTCPEQLTEFSCEVEIKEDADDDRIQSNLTQQQGGSTNHEITTRDFNSNKAEECNENDVILLDDSFMEDKSDSETENREEKRKSILEQVLTGNLTIDDCKEVPPKTKPTSQWWCSPCNSYYRTKNSLMKHVQLYCPRKYTCSTCSLAFQTLQELATHEETDHLKVAFDFGKEVKECQQCDQEFASSEMFRHHRLHDHIDEAWCALCNRFFPTVELYNSHKQLHDSGTIIPEATMNNELSPQFQEWSSDPKTEYFTESVKSLTCPTCGKVCTQQSALSNHMRTHEPKKHKCEICGRSFGLFIRLAAHRLSEHGQHPVMSPIEASVEQEEALNAEREAREARVAKMPMTHGRKSSEILNDDEISMNELSDPNQRPRENANAPKNVARCGICQQWFTDHTTMLTHLQTHSDTLTSKSFSCKLCTKTFKEKWQLNRHEVSHKRGKISHSCKVCSKTFRDKSQLKIHEAIHALSKTYHCPKCNKIFFKEFSLMTHQCTGVPVFGKRNTTMPGKTTRKAPSTPSGNSKKHKLSKDRGSLNNSRSMSSRSRVACEENTKSRNDTLVVDLEDSTKVIFDTDDFPGTSRSNLEPNVQISEPENLPTPVKRTLIKSAGGYRCGVCQSPFVLRDLAVAHLRSAHPMMPYQCPYCKKRFINQYNFTHHIKTDHPNESEN